MYDLGSSGQASMAEPAAKVIAATNSTSTVVKIPCDQAYGPGFEDMQRRIPHCDKAREQAGFRPSRTLGTVIESVITQQRGRKSKQTAKNRGGQG